MFWLMKVVSLSTFAAKQGSKFKNFGIKRGVRKLALAAFRLSNLECFESIFVLYDSNTSNLALWQKLTKISLSTTKTLTKNN